jgi:hypothetical protein
MIKINLTKKQCESLIKMTFIGEWMYNAATTERNPDIEDCKQTVFRQACNQGFKDYFDVELTKDRVDLKADKETECIQTVEDHTNVVFWDILNDYLTERDLRQNYSEEELNKLDKDAFLEIYYKISDHYSDEFEENGIDNLTLNSSLPDFLKNT